MNPWIGCEIRLLRNQLGWSRTQLATHLKCSPLKVVKMEADEVFPLAGEKARLEALSLQVNEHLNSFHSQVKAEAYMNESGADQVQVDDLDAHFVDEMVDTKESID